MSTKMHRFLSTAWNVYGKGTESERLGGEEKGRILSRFSFSIHYSEPRDIKTKKIFFSECIKNTFQEDAEPKFPHMGTQKLQQIQNRNLLQKEKEKKAEMWRPNRLQNKSNKKMNH